MKAHPCKIGTIPALVFFCGHYVPKVGKVMRVRDAVHGSKPFRVLVTRVDDDGYFFADRL